MAGLLCSCLILPWSLQAQTDSTITSLPRVQEPLRVITADSLQISGLNSGNLQKLKTIQFYDSLKIRASRTLLTRQLYDILFVVPSSGSYNQHNPSTRAENYFYSYQGMVIRSIGIQKLAPFGTMVWDTLAGPEGWLGKGLNTLHVNTRDRIVRKNLVFDSGERIDPMLLAENERILRALPFVEDARILVARAGIDSVDLVVVTKDVFSLGFNIAVGDLNEGAMEVFERNLLGLGHEWEHRFLWDGDLNTKTGYEGIYRVNNIMGSFINARFNYYRAFGEQNHGIHLYRDFITPRTRYAGGIHLRYVNEFLPADTSGFREEVEYIYQDYWLGRSFLINPSDRSRIVTSARYISNRVFRRPEETSATSFYNYHTRSLLLGSLGFTRENFYSGKLIYNYGPTEDISFGTLMEITGGLEINEFNTRGIAALRLAAGKDFPGFGYLAASLATGGFLREGMFEQSVLSLKTSYFSPLLIPGRYRIRNFIDLDYTVGIRRFSDEELSLSGDYGIRGLRSDNMKGTRRLSLNMESVLFSPIQIYGFSFAFFGWADLGLIGSGPGWILPADLYSGFGMGVRVRNENLVFKTFQIRLAAYPVLPPDARWSTVTFGQERSLTPMNFGPSVPGVIPYR